MKKKILFLQILMFTMFEKVYAVNKLSCGTTTGIPEGLPGFIKTIITLIEFLVPLALILFGSVDFLKVIFSEDKKGLDKAVHKFITRSVAGVAIFFVTFITLLIFKNLNNGSNTAECIRCFAIDKKYCKTYYEEEEDHTEEKEQKDKERQDIEEEREKHRKENEEAAKKEKEIAESEKDPDNILNGSKTGSEGSSGDKPVSVDGSLVKSEDSSTLKVAIYKVDGYYITSLWVKNPYEQLEKYDSPEYGTNLYKPKDLLQKAISKNSLDNDLLVGFNASGFYLAGYYDSASVTAYPAYNKTSVGTLVITNNKVVRNAYEHADKTWYVMGVDKNNKMNIYEDAASSDANAKREWSNTVIGNIRNTYTFASPLVENGFASNKTTSMPSPGAELNRQAICQIDNNRFIIITGSGLNRTELTNIMLKYKCKTGTNLDGGGSIALLYKSRTSSTVETITGGGRALTEVAYFRGSGATSGGPVTPAPDGSTYTNTKTNITYKIYNQADSRWGSTQYPDKTGSTIKSRGCMITSVAVVSSSSDPSITPLVVFNKYRHTGPRDSIPQLTNNEYTCRLYSYNGNKARAKSEIKAFLNQGKVVVIKVYGSEHSGSSPFTGSQHYMALLDINSDGTKAFVGNAAGSGTGRHAATWHSLDDLSISLQTAEVCTPSQSLIDKYNSNTPGSKTIIIGDSRTVGMCANTGGNYTVCQYDNSGGYYINDDLIIAKGAMGYSWMVSTAIPAVNRKLQSDPGTRYNIISLMGVNGLDVTNYVKKYNELANGDWKNHNIILVSVNPVDYQKELANGYSTKPESILFFNATLQAGTAGKSNISYCDTYSKIINNFNTTDGLHYDGPTYKKINQEIHNCIK